VAHLLAIVRGTETRAGGHAACVAAAAAERAPAPGAVGRSTVYDELLGVLDAGRPKTPLLSAPHSSSSERQEHTTRGAAGGAPKGLGERLALSALPRGHCEPVNDITIPRMGSDDEIAVDDSFSGTAEDVLETSMHSDALEVADITSAPLQTPPRNGFPFGQTPQQDRDNVSPVFEFDSPGEVGVTGALKPFQQSPLRNRGHAIRNGGVPELRDDPDDSELIRMTHQMVRTTPARPRALLDWGRRHGL
jgi:hypothetical protein